MSEIETVLKDMQHYLWLSSLRDCWKDTEKDHVNKLYNRIVSLIELQKNINEELECKQSTINTSYDDIHDRNYNQAEQDMYKHRRDSEHLKFWLQNL